MTGGVVTTGVLSGGTAYEMKKRKKRRSKKRQSKKSKSSADNCENEFNLEELLVEVKNSFEPLAI